jgi:hypothetical protein
MFVSEVSVSQFYSGGFYWPLPASGAMGGGTGGVFGFGSGSTAGSYTGGYVSGSGTVISSIDQIIEIQYDGLAPYPVHVGPGSNEIYFYIPVIKGKEEELKDAQVTIKSEGTVLIPGGFIIIKRDGDKLMIMRTVTAKERFKFDDFISLDIINIPPPPVAGSVGHIEDFGFEDFTNVELEQAIVPIITELETIDFTDFISVLSETPVPPQPDTHNVVHTDIYDFEDFIGIEHVVDVPPDLSLGPVDDVNIGDFADIEKIAVIHEDSKEAVESVEIEDFAVLGHHSVDEEAEPLDVDIFEITDFVAVEHRASAVIALPDSTETLIMADFIEINK